MEWVEKSAQMGDTFGGLLSPIIGFISIYFIYKTFKSQNKQLDDQRNQHHISRITDIIYQQIQRIDENLRAQTFDVDRNKEAGTAGLRSVRHSLEKEDREYIHLVNDNTSQLLDYYECVLNSVRIVKISIKEACLTKKNTDELYRLFLLNLSDNTLTNIDKILLVLDSYFTHTQNENNNSAYAEEQFDFRIDRLTWVLTEIAELVKDEVGEIQ